MQKLFGTDGIRGTANEFPITAEIALRLGQATAAVMRQAAESPSRRVIIGKDTRRSGYMLETALTSGLVGMGMDVYLVGPMPTPAVAHLTKSMGAACGLMITASHNPARDNGIKIFDRNGFKLSDALEAEIELLIRNENPLPLPLPDNDDIGKAFRIEDARGRYIEFAKSTIGSRSLKGLKIVLDCSHGAGYFLGPLIFRELGAEVIKLNVSPDGCNINLNCGALYPEQLREAVLREKADIGIALDGDADRLVVCDHRGEVLDGDSLLGLLALAEQEKGQLRHNQLVVTVMSNLGLHHAMKERGIQTITTPVGDRHVIEAMRKHGATLGGEQSGHVIFMHHATTGDGIISALQLLGIMVEHQLPLADLVTAIPLFPQTLVNIPVESKPPLEEIPGFAKELQACTDALGADGRHLVRYSGTENKVRILLEAKTQVQVDTWIERLGTILRREIGAC